MAERRMFAKQIVDSDAFLDMPLAAQALYFHLSMRADDDGFVNNPKKIQRMICAGDDDFQLLLDRTFIIPFDNGVCVIRHWKIHNYIQKDRYHETPYKAEKRRLELDENNMYIKTDTDCITDSVQDVSKMLPQVRLELGKSKDRLGKDRDKNTIGASAPDDGVDKQPPHTKAGFEQFWSLYPKKVGKQAALKSWSKLKPNAELTQRILAAVKQQKRSDQWSRDNGQYIPNPATWLNQGRWDDELSEKQSAKENSPATKFKPSTGFRKWDDNDMDDPASTTKSSYEAPEASCGFLPSTGFRRSEE